MTGPRDWLDFAREDLEMSEFSLKEGIYNQTCFHAQQGVEKSLKAFLKTRQASVPKIHGLSELVALCRGYDEDFLKLEDACAKLDHYYIPTRYPDVFPGAGPAGPPTERDAKEALALLRETLDWVAEKLT